MFYMLKLLVRLMKEEPKVKPAPKVAAKNQPERLHKPLPASTLYSDRPYGSVKYLEDMQVIQRYYIQDTHEEYHEYLRATYMYDENYLRTLADMDNWTDVWTLGVL